MNDECGIILESLKVEVYNPHGWRISFVCKTCGNRSHFLERDVFPEIQFAEFIARVFNLHTYHNPKAQAGMWL